MVLYFRWRSVRSVTVEKLFFFLPQKCESLQEIICFSFFFFLPAPHPLPSFLLYFFIPQTISFSLLLVQDINTFCLTSPVSVKSVIFIFAVYFCPFEENFFFSPGRPLIQIFLSSVISFFSFFLEGSVFLFFSPPCAPDLHAVWGVDEYFMARDPSVFPPSRTRAKWLICSRQLTFPQTNKTLAVH